MRLLMALIFTFVLQLNQVQAVDFNWSKQFSGGNGNFNIGLMDGNSEGFVATRPDKFPIEYINANGALECHVFYRYKNGILSTTGDISNGSSSCPEFYSGANTINAIEAFGPDICVGGDFANLAGIANMNYFACYSPTLGWYQPNGIGNGPDNIVYAVESDINNTALYVGGLFQAVDNGATSAKHIVKTDGNSWEPLFSDAQHTDNGSDTSVVSILSTTSFLFTNSGGIIRSWNSAIPEWKDRGLSNGGLQIQNDMVINGDVVTITSKGATDISGDTAGSLSNFDINGEFWTPTTISSIGLDTQANHIAYGLGPLYATGDFSNIDANAKGVAILVNNEWQAIPGASTLGDLDAKVTEMQQAASEFCMRAALPLDAELYWRNVICYNGTKWQEIENAPVTTFDNTDFNITSFQNKIHAFGEFTEIGDQRSNYVAKLKNNGKWKGVSQLTQSSGQGRIENMQEYNGHLYAIGAFDNANGTAVSNFAKWDGTNWSEVTIPNVTVRQNSVMTVWNNKLVISAKLNFSNKIISWDGVTVEDLTGRTTADSLNVYQGDLIASVASTGVYKYDNNGAWDLIVTSKVSSMAVDGSDLYVFGNFSSTCGGSLATNSVVRWDGVTCHALGTGIQGNASFDGDIVAINGDVIVTGEFTTAGGTAVNNLAYWDGATWSAMGVGLIGTSGNHLYLDGNDLYITGHFTQAGDVFVNNFAKVELIFDRIFINGFE